MRGPADDGAAVDLMKHVAALDLQLASGGAPVHAAPIGRSTFHRTSGRVDETGRRQTFAQSGATIKGRSDANPSKIGRRGLVSDS